MGDLNGDGPFPSSAPSVHKLLPTPLEDRLRGGDEGSHLADAVVDEGYMSILGRLLDVLRLVLDERLYPLGFHS